jgi:hypothetical protein
MANSTSSTTTQIIKEDPQIEAYRLGLLNSAKSLVSNPSTVPAYQVAGLSPYETQAMELAQQGLGAYQPYMNTAVEALQGSANSYSNIDPIAQNLMQQGQSVADGSRAMYDTGITQDYMNPYQQAVTQQSMQEIDRQAAIGMQGVKAQGIASGAYGGSRQGIAEGEFTRNVNDLKMQKILQDYSNNYQQAQSAGMSSFENAQSRGLQGAQMGLGSLQTAGQMYGSMGEAYGNLGSQFGNLGSLQSSLNQEQSRYLAMLGGVQRENYQGALDAQRQTEAARQYEPYQRLGFLSDIYSKTPTSQSTITQSSAPAASGFSSALGSGIQAYAMYQGLNNLYSGTKTT